jgi:hypothetical protein
MSVSGITIQLRSPRLRCDLSQPTVAVRLQGQGAAGSEIELQVNATHIQWRYAGTTAWTNLIALSALEGAPGEPGAAGTSGMLIAREVWTLTPQNIIDKYLALTFLPDRKLTQLTIENGAAPLYGEDFTVTVEPPQLSWDSLGLDGLLQAGDSFSFEYSYSL